MLSLEEYMYTKFLIICFYIHIKQEFLWFQPCQILQGQYSRKKAAVFFQSTELNTLQKQGSENWVSSTISRPEKKM